MTTRHRGQHAPWQDISPAAVRPRTTPEPSPVAAASTATTPGVISCQPYHWIKRNRQPPTAARCPSATTTGGGAALHRASANRSAPACRPPRSGGCARGHHHGLDDVGDADEKGGWESARQKFMERSCWMAANACLRTPQRRQRAQRLHGALATVGPHRVSTSPWMTCTGPTATWSAPCWPTGPARWSAIRFAHDCACAAYWKRGQE